uniref:VP3 n=1 Tax=Skunk River virus TaxID=2488682 RepID=A0A3S8RBU3_9REOV|nr:VP3 [Skunk River virus]
MAEQRQEDNRPPTTTRNGPQGLSSAPYLRGEEIRGDDGILLSVFALQEMLNKVREAQLRMRMASIEVESAAPDVSDLIKGLESLKDLKAYRIERNLKKWYRHVTTQSDEKFFQISAFMEEVSKIGTDANCENAIEMINLVLARVHKIRDEGAFLLWDLSTHYTCGDEIVDADALGIDFGDVFAKLNPRDRHMISQQLEQFVVSNRQQREVIMDNFTGACPDPIYRIHTALTAYVLDGQRGIFRSSMEWLQRYGVAKEIEFSRELLTDILSPNTVYCLSYHCLLIQLLFGKFPDVVYRILFMNAALGVPIGQYILPNPRIASITVTSRITTSTAFSQLQSMVATESQMNDVRKIYLALMFPNQILLDVSSDPGHSIDPVVQGVAGLLGKIMFSYGPQLFNITARSARLLDKACASYFQATLDDRRDFRRGHTGQPLDFRFNVGREAFDYDQLSFDPNTGAGYNGWRVNSVVHYETPYPHVRRRIQYLGYDARDIIDERFSGDGYMFPTFELILRALQMAGHVNERNYLMLLLQHHVVRFAYISQIINRDLLSAFSLPDDKFNGVRAAIVDERGGNDGPIILSISYHSIWHAFKMRFLPTERPQFLHLQPLIETIFASHISVAKLAYRRMRDFSQAYMETFMNIAGGDVWKAIVANMPDPVRKVLEMTSQFGYINVSDVHEWAEGGAIQDSLALLNERNAWDCVEDPTSIMFVRDVFLCRDSIPEPVLEDVEQFRREAVFYTNVRPYRPNPMMQVLLNRQSAEHRAGEGRLKLELRSFLDDGLYIKVGDGLRPFVLEFYNELPPQNVRESLPFVYESVEGEGPIARVKLFMRGVVRGFVIFYKADDKSLPDSLTSYIPPTCLTQIVMPRMPFQKVSADNVLSIVDKNFSAFRKKVNIYDLTAVLEAGSRYATPHME